MVSSRFAFAQLFASGTVLFGGFAASAAPVTFELSKEKSDLTWHGKKEIGDGHTGKIKIAGGNVVLDGNEIKSAEITIDTASITNLDVKDPTFNKKLVDHLKSEDFFKVDSFKTATFTSKTSTKIDGGKAALAGKLEIRGKSSDFTVNLSDIKVADATATAAGKMVFDRTKFDVKYNSASFPDLFKVAKDKIIKNDVELDFKLVADKKSSTSN